MDLFLAYAAIPYLVTLAISVALSAAAYFLLRPKGAGQPRGNTKESDFTLSNIASQGAYVPLLIGRRRIGAVIAWVGDRRAVEQTQSLASGGAKGLLSSFAGGVPFGSRGRSRRVVPTGQLNYQESAWHLLCVGPARKLYRVWSEGKLIFEPAEPLTPDNTPSGTAVVTPEAGFFYLYWGEDDQPVNTHLADASRVGIASRWPSMCYAVWVGKWLGPTPHWPQIEYDIEAGYEEPLRCTQDFVNVTGTDGTPIAPAASPAVVCPDTTVGDWNDTFTTTLTIPTAGWYRLDSQLCRVKANYYGDVNEPIINGVEFDLVNGATRIELVDLQEAGEGGFEDGGWTIPDPIDCWSYDFEQVAVFRDSFLRTYVYLASGVWDVELTAYINIPTGLTDDVRVDCYFEAVPISDPVLRQAGAGYTHEQAMRQILFDSYPHGVGFPPDNFYTGSLDDTADPLSMISVCTNDEGLDASVIALEGETAGNILGTILQDAGFVWCRNFSAPVDGKNFFRAVREEADPLPTIPADAVLPTETEIEVLHVERAVDRIMFSFADATRAFRESVITVDEDGQPRDTGNVRGTIARIGTVVHFGTAAKIAARRSQEELAGGGRFTIFAGRDARLIIPGQAIMCYGIPWVLRVGEVSLDPTTSKTQLECILDHYGAPASAYAPEEIPTSGGAGVLPEPNLRETFLEIPEFASLQTLPTVAALRVRANDQIGRQIIHLSADDATYTQVGQDTAVHAGGDLTSGLTATDDFEIESGPTFDVVGDDITDVAQDLTADEAAWRSGRQVVLIGEELFFLRNVEALGGSSYRLRGLLRARYDTERAAHAAGADVFIFPGTDGLVPFPDPLIAPGATLYVKQQPAADSILSLTDVTSVSKTIKGKGLVPMAPAALEVVAPALGVAAYSSGEDVEFRWAHRSTYYPGSGAGMQPAGSAVGSSPSRGTFEVQVYDAMDVLVATYGAADGVTESGWTYDNGDLQTDLGGETDFRIEVRNINGGWRSDPIELSVEAI